MTTQALQGLRRLWDGELPEISEKYRGLATAFVVLFAVGFALGFLGLLHYVAYLGPGLGDDWNLQPLKDLWQSLGAESTPGGLGISLAQGMLVLLVLLNLGATAGIIIAGYLRYPQAFGQAFPMRTLVTFFAMSTINTLSITLSLVALALIGGMFGYDFRAAYGGFGQMLAWAQGMALSLPTLIDVPAWAAFLLIYNVGGFFHYWAHRLSHESRVLWLLFHRPHHMTPELIQPTAQAVFFAFPLFLVAAVPYVFVFTAISKLITEDIAGVLGYVILFKLVAAWATTFSHQGAMYHTARRSPLIRALSQVVSEGPYHYLHHSAEAAEHCPRGNLVNIGGGMGFIWDRLFGTYRPLTEQAPRVGLMGQPPLHMNPIRLSFAGLAQLGYELWHNRGWRERLRILFLGSDYQPPRTRDFALK